MGEDRDLGVAPAKPYIRVMALLLGQRAHALDELQSRPKVPKTKLAPQMMPLDDFPIRDLTREPPEFIARERRRIAPARLASYVGEVFYGLSPVPSAKCSS